MLCFYFFDVGIVNQLLKRKEIEQGSEVFGNAFEHFIYQEIYAHSSYSGLDYTVSYWRTTSQIEIDFVLGDNEVAIEIKSSDNENGDILLNKKFDDRVELIKLVRQNRQTLIRIFQSLSVYISKFNYRYFKV